MQDLGENKFNTIFGNTHDFKKEFKFYKHEEVFLNI